jgi:hypothetical protein
MMLGKLISALSAAALMLCGIANNVAAQGSIPLPSNTAPTSVVVSFPAKIQQVEGTAIPANQPPSPSIYFKEAGKTIYLTATASLIADNQISLSDFKSLAVSPI